MPLRLTCTALALAVLATLTGCRHTSSSAYRATCAPVCAPACPAPCPTPVVAASPIAVAAPAPCCGAPGIAP